ncbi:hypothetical protein [Kluyvera ascorbata]|uniref:hypothetical protein n=1 Tax=Kluyvera ascorbata TaxID=51288 RepID=UPI0034D435A8|nr:hypothetical protein [Kluyvera ascorbata]
MDKLTREIIVHADQALAYSTQALAVLDIWMDAMATDDEQESRRVAAVDTLLREAVSYLEKIRGVAV